MQTPLFWLDISEYNGAQLKAVVSDDKIRGLMVDMSAGPDRVLEVELNMLGFKPAEQGKPHLRYAHGLRVGQPNEIRARLFQRLDRSEEIPFDASEHLAIADAVREAEKNTPARAPVHNRAASEQVEAPAAPAREAEPEPEPEPAKAAPKVPKRESTAQAGKEKIEDVGEVRGFAIKDLHGSRARAVVAEMTQDQADAFITKESIWPAPDYKAMAEAGVEPGAAALLKAVRDEIRKSVNAQPRGRRMGRRRANPELYVHYVQMWRDTFKNISTLAQAATEVWRTADQMLQFEQNVHSRATRFKPPIEHDSAGEPIQETGLGTLVQGRRSPFWFAMKAKDEAEAHQACMSIVAKGMSLSRSNTQWSFLARNHPLRTGGSAALSDEEKQRRAEAEANKAPTRIPRTHHSNAERKGLPAVREGDVDPAEMIRRYDLSGTEFGNWEGQADRQELLNQAFDSFNDLAEVLNVPYEAIGFGGRLGMAFGSRGRGGKNAAAAHFEPVNFAINMTKYAGAGSLAHEWGHAMDRAFTSRGIKGRKAYMASDDMNGRPTNAMDPRRREFLTIGDTTANNFNEVVREIMTDSEETKRGIAKIAANSLQRTAADALVSAGINDVAQTTGPFDAQRTAEEGGPRLARFWAQRMQIEYSIGEADADWLADRLSEGAVLPTDEHKQHGASVIEALGKYAPLWNEQMRQGLQNDIEFGIGEMRRFYAYTCAHQAIRDPDNPVVLPSDHEQWSQTVERFKDKRLSDFDRSATASPSAMLATARKMDADRTNKYWSTTREMVARAFEVYVHHKLAQRGGKNDYLVSYGVPKSANGKEYPSIYPQGAHLERVAAAFDRMFEQISLEHRASVSPMRENEQGVVMYSIDGDKTTAGVPDEVKAEMLIAEVQGMIGHIAEVRTPDDLGEHNGRSVAGRYDVERQLIEIAMNGGDPRSAAHHEAYHAASVHLLTDTERAVVSAAFDVGGRYRKDLERALLRDNKHHVISQIQTDNEEATAYGFQYWMAGRLDMGSESPVGALFKRVKDFYEGIKNAVKGYTFMTTNEVFSKLESGDHLDRFKAMSAPQRPAHEAVNALRRGDEPDNATERGPAKESEAHSAPGLAP